MADPKSIDASDSPREGPTEAEFRRLFDEHYGFVRRTLAHFGLDAVALDDAAQDVFLIVHRRWSTYDGRPIRSWLWGISRRIAGSHNRTEGRAGRRLSVAPAPTESPRPDEVAERNEAIAFVDRFLRQLDEDKRAVFQLAEIEGVSAPEIGEILGVKLNTVYSRLRAARERFSRELERYRARERREDRQGDHERAR